MNIILSSRVGFFFSQLPITELTVLCRNEPQNLIKCHTEFTDFSSKKWSYCLVLFYRKSLAQVMEIELTAMV